VTKISDTAAAMLAIIGEHDGHPVMSADMYQGLIDRVGTAKYMPEAAAHLREHGVLLVAEKARQHSNWRVLDPDIESSDSIAKWEERVRRESLTEVIREAQALAPASHIAPIRQSRNRVVANAVTLGADLGMDAATVLAMCEPLDATA
jgi:hypothetical protein